MVIVHTKSSNIAKFLQMWISISGPPKQTFSDNGGVLFHNILLTYVKTLTLISKQHQLSLLGQCHNKILSNIIVKIKEDISCSWENALGWGANAKNSLININAFNPHQLVFG